MEISIEQLLEILDMAYFFALPDYLVLACIFLSILLIFLMSIELRMNALLFFLFFLLSGALCVASPFIYQKIMEDYVKKIDFTLVHNEKLHYDQVYFIEGSFKNLGLLDFRGCVVLVDFIPKGLNQLETLKYALSPEFSHTQIYNTPLKRQDSMEFKFVVVPPDTEVDYVLKTKGACY